jgi:hypothetical protein
LGEFEDNMATKVKKKTETQTNTIGEAVVDISGIEPL